MLIWNFLLSKLYCIMMCSYMVFKHNSFSLCQQPSKVWCFFFLPNSSSLLGSSWGKMTELGESYNPGCNQVNRYHKNLFLFIHGYLHLQNLFSFIIFVYKMLENCSWLWEQLYRLGCGYWTFWNLLQCANMLKLWIIPYHESDNHVFKYFYWLLSSWCLSTVTYVQ